MVTLEDISLQLMKPAKDLANWSFPLSQILQEYYALLEEPRNINFGEAALVLQNSANVYVRRVECLLDETMALQQIFCCENDELNKNSKNDKKSTNKYIDIDDFKTFALDEEVGKNINMKNQYNTQKSVKLISRRFTQLENNIIQLHTPIEMYDIYGEIIGKKYDFRCNQPLNMNGILVDDLTPDDFNYKCDLLVEDKTLLSETDTSSSGYFSNSTICENDLNNTNFTHNTVINDYTKSLEDCRALEQNYHFYSPDTIDISDASTIEEDVPFANTETINGKNITNCNNYNAVFDNLTSIQNQKTNIDNFCKSIKSEDEQSNIQEDTQTEKCKESMRIKKTEQRYIHTKPADLSDSSDNNIMSSSNCYANNLDANGNNLNTLENSQKGTTLLRRSQRIKNLMCANGMNQVIPKSVLSACICISTVYNTRNNGTGYKLPCHISLLKHKSTTRKRRKRSKVYKQEQFSENKFTLSQKRANNYIPIKSKKGDLEEFQNNTKKYFKNTQGLDVLHYNPINTTTTNLLEFRLRSTEEDSLSDNINYTFDMVPSCMNTPRSRSLSPAFSSSSMQPDVTCSLSNYQRLIENKMKEIFKESAGIEIESTVAKWHKLLQPKLAEAERKPVFRIYDYTSRVLQTLQTTDERRINFDAIIQGKPASEVARYFLASLQLANTYNVDINVNKDNDSLEIILVNEEREDQNKKRKLKNKS